MMVEITIHNESFAFTLRREHYGFFNEIEVFLGKSQKI
jgi:hypothetical protein